ncbi:hypothetical protein AB9P05_24005 [Roseivirga sp. BDSF3-8]|uniref:hypothetical protein n=1 Tax=Roseivirga sp. BDSF3-8 TaxID=3241598 RepID=UPI0035326F9D
MTTLYISLLAVTILLLGANVYFLRRRHLTGRQLAAVNPDNLATKHILKLAIEYIHEENMLYQATLQEAIDFIESLNLSLSYYQQVGLDDLKYDELNLRTRYAPQKLEEGLVSALQEYILKTSCIRQQLSVSLNEESPVELPQQQLAYYYGILTIIMDSYTGGMGKAEFCQINVGQNEQMAWAEIVTDSALDLSEHLRLEKMQNSPESMAFAYRELLSAHWNWVRKDKYQHFYLHVPFDRNGDYSDSSLSA